jgi:hypothetical protein
LGTTNEQAVAAFGARSAEMKRLYTDSVKPIVDVVQGGGDPSQRQLIEAHSAATAYFNEFETFVGESGLLGAHRNGFWVTGFAETCHAILETIVSHVDFMRTHGAALNGVSIEPSPYAYANMQRFTVEYLPRKAWRSLQKKFDANKLPTTGFKVPAAPDRDKVSRSQLIASVALGVLGLIAMVIISVAIPSPTPWQQFIFRATIAISGAAAIAIVPGFIDVRLRMNGWGSYLTVLAGGAIGVFVLMWFYSPTFIAAAGTEASAPSLGSSAAAK